MPKFISVITPVYNGEKYIENCIEAVAKCNYDLNYVEHIIVDDGSTDNTKKICIRLSQKYKHIRFYSKQNGNWGSVINYVKNNYLARGDYIIVCDSDDIILPNAFKLVNEKSSNADFVIGDFWWFNGKRKTFRVPSYCYLFKKMFFKKKDNDYFNITFYPHCTYLKNDIFYAISDLLEKVYFQDSIMYAQAMLMSKTIKHINKAVSLYWYKRSGNSCTANNELAIKSRLIRLKHYEKEHNLMAFYYFMPSEPKYFKKYLKDNNIKFNFKNCKLNFNGYPFYIRPALWFVYLLFVKRYVKK